MLLTVDCEAGSGLVHAQVTDCLALIVASHLHGAVNQVEGGGVISHLYYTIMNTISRVGCSFLVQNKKK